MKIAYWQDGSWCCDTQMPEMRHIDYDVALVPDNATDEEIDAIVRFRTMQRSYDECAFTQAANLLSS